MTASSKYLSRIKCKIVKKLDEKHEMGERERVSEKKNQRSAKNPASLNKRKRNMVQKVFC